MLKWLIKTLLKVLLALVVLLFVFLLFERVRGQISLARYKRELAAKGEKLTFRELIPPLPEGENGAPEILEAIERLQRGAVLSHGYPPTMKVIPSGRAIVGFRESEWVEMGTVRNGEWVNEKVTNRWDQVATDLKTNEATLTQIRLALGKPVLNNKLDYSQGHTMRLEHLALTRTLIFWLEAESQLALHEGKPHEALDSLVAQIHLPHLLREDRLLISELVRIAIAAIARATTWEALQADGWADEDLAKIQQAWQSQDFMTAMVRSLESERISSETAYGELRRSNEEALGMFPWREKWRMDEESHSPWWRKVIPDEVYCLIWQFAWSHQDEQRYLDGIQHLLDIARNAAELRSFAKALPQYEKVDAKIRTENFYDELRFPMTVQFLDYLPRTIRKAMQAETERSLTVCAIALKRYSLRYGKPPASLDSLVPEFLSSVPIDYMDGKPVKYHLNADGSFTLYSVGEDGKDDGGDSSLLPDKLRSLWNRRDFVWPSPALPDEIEAYHEEARKN